MPIPPPPADKPPHGGLCNRCGWCCKAVLCQLARDLFAPARWEEPEVAGPCPALEDGPDGRHACGLIVHPATYFPVKAKKIGNATLRRATRALIGEGIGCDAVADGEPTNDDYDRAIDELARQHDTEIRTAQEVWGVPQW